MPRPTIRDSMNAIGFTQEIHKRLPLELKAAIVHFGNFSLDSHCGSECEHILAMAAPLLKAIDPAAHPDIWRGVVSAMAIICVG